MKVSIAMTAYNGEKYIIQQLESIVHQTYNIDEIIISDDCSKDNSVLLLKKYIANNKLSNKCMIIENEFNKGFINNFFSCIEKSTGDIIFMADQDDIWLPNKVEKMVKIFENDEDISAVVCKENIIDENNNFIKLRKKRKFQVKKISIEEEVKKCYGAGHLLAIRKKLYEENIDIIKKEKLTFDIPFGMISSAKNGLYQVDEALVNRRIHKNNTSGSKTNKNLLKKERYILGRESRLKYFLFLEKYFIDSFEKNKKNEFKEFIDISKNSLNDLKKGKVKELFKELFSNNIFINKKFSIANIYVVIRNKKWI